MNRHPQFPEERIALHLTAGKSGAWKVRQFRISEAEARMDRLRCLINGRPERAVSAGDYWMLTEQGSIYMTNTPAEVADHLPFIRRAEGSVLVAGLGLDMVVQGLIDAGRTRRIVVVEKSADVIRLAGPAYSGDPRVQIIEADIFDFQPQERFDYAWFDIWPAISPDNYPEMQRLHRRFARHAARSSWSCSERN